MTDDTTAKTAMYEDVKNGTADAAQATKGRSAPDRLPRVRTSEAVVLMDYNPEAQILALGWDSGGVYQYTPVPQMAYDMAQEALKQGTLGEFVNKWIRNNKSLAVTKVDLTAPAGRRRRSRAKVALAPEVS